MKRTGVVHDKQRLFELMVRILALMIFIHSVIRQQPGVGHFTLLDYFWDPRREYLTVPLFHGAQGFLTLPFWLPRWAQVIGAVILLKANLRRLAGILLFGASLYICLFNYPSYGVGDPIFIIFGLIFALFPGVTVLQRQRARATLIGTLSAMYGLSALMKLTPVFLSGRVIIDEFSEMAKPGVIKFLMDHRLYSLAVGAGLALEFCAAGIFFASFETLGFLAAVGFHYLNSAQLNWVFSVTLLPIALPFLFDWRKIANRNFFFTFIAGFLVLQVFGLVLSSRISDFKYELIFVFAPLLLMLWLLARTLPKRLGAGAVERVEQPLYRYRAGAFLLCVILAGACRFLQLPTPLGFTQFSGITSGPTTNYILGVRSDGYSIYPAVFGVFVGRWDIRLFYADQTAALYTFPRAEMRADIQRDLCRRDPKLQFVTFEQTNQYIPTSRLASIQNEAALAGIANFRKLEGQGGFTPCY